MIRPRFRAALALLALAPLLAAPAQADEIPVSYRGKVLAVEELPAEVATPGALAAIAEWSDWAREQDYHLHFDPSGRVLLVTKKKAKSYRKEMAKVAEVLERADALFPMPAGSAEAQPAAPVTGAPAAEPEEIPEDAPAGLSGGDGDGQGEEPWSTSWEEGVTQGAQRDALPVLVLIDGDKDLALLLEFLGGRHEHLGPWVEEAKGQAGFVLVSPLVGAWLTRGADLEEWSPLNELVNRLMRLLIVQRYGRVPEWLSQGLAWDAERELMKGIYSYSRRHEFVWASEHTAWDSQLANRWRKRHPEKSPLEMKELATLTRAGFDPEGALLAYGGARFLARHHPDAIAPLFTALEADREAGSRVDHGDGTWTMVPDYEAPPEVQAQLLREHVDPAVFAEMTKYFAKGRNYRP